MNPKSTKTTATKTYPQHKFLLEKNFCESFTNPKQSVRVDNNLEVSVAVGTREIEDKVWGIFLPDNQTELIWDLMQTTLREHGLRTDIAYVDPEFELSPQYVNVYSATNGST